MDALMLPLNWQRVRLGDIAEIIGGGTPSTQITSFWNGSINWFTPTEIGITKYVHKSQRTITPLGLKKSSAKLLPIGTILLTSRASIGDCAILKVVATTNQGFQSLIPLEKINNEFLYYLMLTLKNKLLKLASGSTFLEVSPNKIKNLLIPLPPLNEQIAIANILSDVDRYLYSLRALILKKESIKKALSFELLSQRKRLKGFNQAWQRVRLGDMTTSFTKQTGFDYSASIKPTLIKEQLPNYIPFIQNKDFSGHYINYKTDYFIPNEIAIRFPQILLNEKCLLISIVGSIGNVAVFNHSQDAFTGCAIAVLKFKEKKSLDFVMHFLMSASGQKSLLNIVKASSHKSIILADLRDLLIPLPPLNEQIAIANILSTLDSEIISLKNKKRQFENIKKALNHDLMSAKIRVLKK
ncbi:restriction endonuclease subunit S [Helicobacter pylori]|uniref:restriction endonuclease subunit S n=1 Tax=Helicobacter pylori TaxID=210 RepID=UPI000534B273|nr:restriction endonuclease subunit S [Helicobacter pylori]